MAGIQLVGVCKSYREGDQERSVLVDVSCEIAPQQFVIVLGRSGSGKSTLLQLLGALDVPDQGSIRIGPHHLEQLNDRERTLFRRRHVGFVFQSFNLLPTLTVAENVKLKLALNGVERRRAKERVQHLLERVGLAERAQSAPDRLSGGEQQRIAIAGALAHDPDILIADEPTGNLDGETGAAVVKLLDEVVRSEGKTLIMATHSREMMGVADLIVTIDGGRLHTEVGGSSRSADPVAPLKQGD